MTTPTQIGKPVTNEKGWGYEIVYANGNAGVAKGNAGVDKGNAGVDKGNAGVANTVATCGKILHFETEGKTSLHFHTHKDETLLVRNGKFIIRTINPTNASRIEQTLVAGQTIEIPHYCVHQIHCSQSGDLLEVSSGNDETDKYRIEGGSTSQMVRPLICEGDLHTSLYMIH